jgi:hypothetical protein
MLHMPSCWVQMLWFMRISTLLAGAAAMLLLLFAIAMDRAAYVVFEAAILAVNVCLAYVQWFVLIPQWPGRRM